MPQVDHADTLHHYIRILAPELLTGCEREHHFNPANRKQRFDLAWPAAMMAVEVDGGRYAHAGGSHASNRDYARNRRAVLLGWRLLRFTSSEVKDDPQSCIEDIRTALAR